ncbi:MAG TPA: hypothetical protein VFA07_12595 [Chthonomonadaceae bacterium]|nr:hypothetical protein [Chthonomonadaceae bacterium]
MTYRLIRSFLIASAGALLIGMISLASAHAQDSATTPRRGKGRWQGAHAKRPQNSIWGARPGTRQANRKNSLWGNEARSVQPPSPWTERRNERGLHINPPSPWTPAKHAAGRNFGAGGTTVKGQRQAFHYGYHPAHIGKWASTRPHTSAKSGRWKQNTTPGAWKLKQKAAAQNGKNRNGKHKNDPQAPIQTGLPNK